MNVVREIQRINEQELKLGVSGKASWHHKYRDSAWVYVGGLPLELTEGDVICVMSQWGEVEDFNMPREEKTGKSRGWAWVKYEDQRSTILAVDNFNGAKLLGRTLRVDHCEKYRLPKEVLEKEEQDAALAKYGPGDEGAQASKYAPGHAYVGKEHASEFKLSQGVDVFAAPAKAARPLDDDDDDDDDDDGDDGGEGAGGDKAAKKARKAAKKAAKKEKKAAKKAHKKDKKRRRNDSSDDDDGAGAPKAGFVSEGLGGAPLADPEPPRLPAPSGGADVGVVVDADWRGRCAPHNPNTRRGVNLPYENGRGRGMVPRGAVDSMAGYGGMARRR